MTHFLAQHGNTIAFVIVALFAAVVSLWSLGRWVDEQADRRQVRLIHAPTCPIAADESVTRVLGWADPFANTRREIAALEEIA